MLKRCFHLWIVPLLFSNTAFAAEEIVGEVASLPNISGLDTAWVLIAAFLVFFMHPGFALLEAGFTQARNSVNIILKNFMNVAVGSIAFFIVGFGLMFGEWTPFVGSGYLFLDGLKPEWGTIPGLAFFLFQSMFAATAATIVSGAIAERTQFVSFLVFAFVITAFIYPIVGHWIWGGGWLAQKGFLDFAGSTVVHSVGGWSALAGVLLIGARHGRFKSDYDQKRFSGHSIPLAALGTLILWFGWFGFNPGSELAVEGAAHSSSVALIAMNTNIAAAGGAVSAVLLGWVLTRMAKAGFALNGALGGLVAVTAGCAFVTPLSALIIGLFGGVVIVFVAVLLEKFKLDDAVGAVPVHLGAGITGTLMLGLFHTQQGVFMGGGWSFFLTQFLGVIAVGVFVFVGALIIFKLIQMTLGLRVSAEMEKSGIDLHHGQAAYPDFLM